MKPKIAKALLTSHIIFSVGWLGSVAVFVALALTAICSNELNLVNGLLSAMQISAHDIIVPFCLAALVSGVVEAAGTKWGLFKYYWIMVKLTLTVFSTILLLLHLNPVNMLAEMTRPNTMVMDMGKVQRRVAFDAGAALLVLIFITVVSVYKPWGRISNAINNNTGITTELANQRSRKYIIAIVIGVALVLFLLIHLLKGGMNMR
ncbi:MAG: hypothetical protein JST19_16795 [Bacteroidetes bacterium]|nr:hypothetical protein [Bacteroidota bacterium]